MSPTTQSSPVKHEEECSFKISKKVVLNFVFLANPELFALNVSFDQINCFGSRFLVFSRDRQQPDDGRRDGRRVGLPMVIHT